MSTFPLWHIALTAGIASVATILLLGIGRRWFKIQPFGEIIALAIVVGISVLAWRSAGNTLALNLDPIPGVSPNDMLCPVVTYVFLGLYATLRRRESDVNFEQARAILTLISFAVNVITI